MMIQLLTGILLVFSCLGYMLLIRKRLSLQWEFIPLFTFSSIACLVFFGGLVGQLFTISLAVLILGLLAFIWGVILWKREGASIRFSFSIFQASFLVGTVIFLLVLFRNPLTHYDNFSHWAIVLKLMLSTDAFPTAGSALIDFKNYPLGTSSFIYYVCRFAGHSQTTMLFAQVLLIFSCFYAMFGIVSEKRRFMLYAFLGAGLSMLSFFNITIRITNLLVDFLLPIYALAILAVLYRYRNDLKNACMVILPIAGLLTIIKSTGIIFAAIGFMYLIYITVTYKRMLGWTYTLLVVGTICGALLPYFGWSLRMATVFQGVANKFDVASSGLQSTVGGKTPEQVHEIISLFLKSSIDLATRPAMGIVVFHLVAIVASLFAAEILRKKWNLWKVLIALDIVMLLYYAGILGLYVYSMPPDEAIWLAGFERYASSIVVLFVGGLVLCATVDIERSFHYKHGEMPDARAFKNVRTKGFYQNGIWACTVFAVILLLSEYNGILSIASSYKTTLPYKIDQVTGDRWYANGKVDTSKYLFYASDTNQQVTNYYMQYIGKYYLYASNVDGICLFYEDNMDNLLSGYDYLVVIEKDSDGQRLLKKHYGVDMQAGIYQITRSGEQVVLTRQNDK
ncbi:hypothetical protein GC096_15820 [Paenibacillus sp. LMG 31461]|uniref:Glycosyltransferase RgtA/B/C/D-like domain-containing protein n=1 Tax=Paenibacillus plantarum TaxID=2654975 RepID=A0ABX1XAM7_9BACL|nr:hypothetical protein [Paenibacillus plantarum]NOU65503.1 hypothetical protein [Paenibacillus plantarum]